MSNSWTETLRQYVKSRLPGRLYLPCAALLVTAGLADGHCLSAADAGLSCLLAWALLLQFRLLDDVSDLPHDRQAHPDRVLVRATSLTPYYALMVVCALGNLALLTLREDWAYRAATFVLLNAAFLLWYCGVRKILTGRVIAYHVVAAKYPVFVFLLSGDGGRWSGLSLSAALIFLCFAIFEVLHDRSLHAVPRAEKVLRLEIGAFFAISVLMTVELTGAATAIVVLQGLLAVISLLVLGELFGRRRVHLESPETGYLVFAIAFALLITFSLGVRS